LETDIRRETGESGVWMHFGKGLRDPDAGKYSVELWKQERWAKQSPLILSSWAFGFLLLMRLLRETI
jgi:hypothetical protein